MIPHEKIRDAAANRSRKPSIKPAWRRARWLTLSSGLLAAAGCVTPGPDAEFYTLSKPSNPDFAAPAANTPAIVVGPVQVPEVLDRPQIVTRADGHRLNIHEFHRWGGSLGEEMARAIQADLIHLLDSDRVALHGVSAFPADFRIGLDVERFEGALGGEVVLEVRWSIFADGGGKLASAHRSRVVETAKSPGFESLVAAHSRALGTVSRFIAEEIRRLRNAH